MNFKFKTSDDKEYTIEYNRKSVKYAENIGFNINRIERFDNKIMTNTEDLFFVGFKMHHPEVTREEAETILYDELGGLSGEEIKSLVSMYMETYTSLINDNEGGEKNVRRATIL